MYLLIDIKNEEVIAKDGIVDLSKKIDVSLEDIKSALFYHKKIAGRYRVISDEDATNNYILNTTRKQREDV